MRLYFVRHGQVDENVQNIMLGNITDPELNATGVQQAGEVKLDNDFDVFFTSPMKRCRGTAEIINEKLNIPLIPRAELIERGKGRLEGKTSDAVLKESNGLFTEDYFKKNLEVDFSPWGGESVEQVRARLKSFLNDVLTNYKDKKVLICTHMGILRVLHAMYDHVPANFDNASVHVMELK